MTRFTRQFLAFQACLTRLKARLGFCCTFRLKIDSAQLSFFLPVILNQRNIAWTDIGAGAAFDTVIDIMRARFFMIAALAIPVKLLRQQLRRTGIRAGAAADTGLLFLRCSHFAGGRRQNTVGNFYHRHVEGGQGKAHEWPAHDHHLTRTRLETDLAQQVTDRGTKTPPDIARLRNRIAGQRDHALGDGFTINNRTLNRPGGTDVLHQDANIG